MSSLETPDSIVLVSGATGGIGRAVVAELAGRGTTVVLLGRDASKLAAVIDGLPDLRDRLFARTADINDPRSVDAAVAWVAAEFGTLDGVVHAAGDGPVAAVADATDTMWHDTVNSKLMGAVRLTRAAAPIMTERGHGRIVLVNGAFHKTPHPEFVVNSAVNAALAAFAKAVSFDLGRRGVRVYVVDPGAVDTALWAVTARDLAIRVGVTADEVTAGVVAQTPLGSLTTPADVAGVVAFLFSAAAAPITGTAITVDGGACAAL